ncbi:MAG: S9 family peptidase [Bryobacteraceae bacterium]
MPYLVVFLLAATSVAAAEWTVADSFRLKRIAETTPSPDGSRVVWTETEPVTQGDKSEWSTRIWTAAADGENRRPLTRGAKSTASLQFSADGGWLYFLAERNGAAKNVYRIRIDGGEAEQVTDFTGAVGSYALAPSGKAIVLTGVEKDEDAEKRKKEKTDWRVVEDSPRNHSLWTLDVDTELPAKPKRLVAAGDHISNPVWSPDSKRIAFERRSRPDADNARHADLAEADAATGESKTLADSKATESDPHYSPDGRFLAWLHQPGARLDAVRIHLTDRRTGETRVLPATANADPNIAGWTPDSRALLYSESAGTQGALWRMPVDGPPARAFAPREGVFAGVRLSADGKLAAFAHETPAMPAEAYAMPMGGAGPVRVSAANSSLGLPAAPRAEVVRWKAKDGLEIEGLLVHPTAREEGKRVPLVLLVHGGPSGAWAQSFVANPGRYPVAVFASKGYAVLMPNPRGSTAYGLEFRRKVVEDWGGRDFGDLMAGVDHVIAAGVADPERLAIMGWSYGGYMTAWAVTQTNRFKAAAMGAAITDHVSMYGTQDIPSVYEDYFGGPPWDRRDVYARSSPINFIDRVSTPMLILHGEDDHRVPVTQGYEYRRALARRGVPVRMVVYPRQGHAVTEPKLQRHVMEEHAAWADKYLR